jgi:hypothetical protein
MTFPLRAIRNRKNFASKCPISDYSGRGMHFLPKQNPNKIRRIIFFNSSCPRNFGALCPRNVPNNVFTKARCPAIGAVRVAFGGEETILEDK